MKYFKGKNTQFFIIAGHMFILFAVTLILSYILSVWVDNNKKIIQINFQDNSKRNNIKPNPDIVSTDKVNDLFMVKNEQKKYTDLKTIINNGDHHFKNELNFDQLPGKNMKDSLENKYRILEKHFEKVQLPKILKD